MINFIEDISHDIEFFLDIILFPKSISRVNKNSVMLVWVDKRDNIISMLSFKEGAFIMGIDFENVHHLDVFNLKNE